MIKQRMFAFNAGTPANSRVLIACESSGTVREVFRAAGHDAYSCDIKPAEDGSPFHIQRDAISALDEGWGLLVAHPPCTYLCSSGLHWNKRRPGREALTDEALAFVRALMDAKIPKIAIENPVGRIGTAIRPADQTVQPWMFGDDASKATQLWLKGLPKLAPTDIIEPRWVCCGITLLPGVGKYGCANCNGESKAKPRWSNQTNSGQNKLGPSEDRARLRSLTYLGIARAMANQWGT